MEYVEVVVTTLILGVFPRTRSTTLSNDPFGTMSGFYGTLVNNGVISGEFNEQVGPATLVVCQRYQQI